MITDIFILGYKRPIAHNHLREITIFPNNKSGIAILSIAHGVTLTKRSNTRTLEYVLPAHDDTLMKR